MTQHSELYERIIKTQTDESDRADAFRAEGPTVAAYRKMSKARQKARQDAEDAQRKQSRAQTLGELMTIACELHTPLELVALTTRIAKKDGDGGTSAYVLANTLLGELIEAALEIERKRVTGLLRAA